MLEEGFPKNPSPAEQGRKKLISLIYDSFDPNWGLSMTTELKPEQERIIQEEIRSGHFRNVDEGPGSRFGGLREKSAPLDSEPREPRKNLAQFLMESPLAGSGLDLERDKDPGCDIEL